MVVQIFSEQIFHWPNHPHIPRMFQYRYIPDLATRYANWTQTGVIKNLVGVMKRGIGDAFLNQFGNRNRVLNSVRGYVTIGNTNTGHYRSSGVIYLKALKMELLEEMIQAAVQSGDDTDIFDLTFDFNVTPQSVIRGGMKRVGKNYENNKDYLQTYEEQFDIYGKINCGAYALSTILMDKSGELSNMEIIKQNARELQDQCGWNDMVSIQQLEKFVQVYPQYRVTVLFDHLRNFKAFTYTGTDFNEDSLTDGFRITSRDKDLYLLYSNEEEHYISIKNPNQVFRKISSALKFCRKCVLVYHHGRVAHECNDTTDQRIKRKRKCIYCNVWGDYCECSYSQCQFCKAKKLKGDQTHTCIVMKPSERKDAQNRFFTELEEVKNGEYYSLWTYDFESCLHITEKVLSTPDEFEVDDDFKFTGQVKVFSIQAKEHVVNLIVAKNTFTKEKKMWYGVDCLKEFLLFMQQYNKGKNMCFAHNASGYDTRLLFEEACKLQLNVSMEPILRGTKFLQLKIGHVYYRDSMLHIPGSLKDLAKTFTTETILEKGFFPHLFNTPENQNYIGKIPDKKYFDPAFGMKTQKDFDEFNEWYDSWNGRTDWNFKEELIKYCENDVDVLCEIMKGFHDILFEKFGMSPWFNTTAPSFVHELVLRKLYLTLELPDPKQDPDGYNERMQVLIQEYWVVLKETEYWFARKALRGGRTEIRKVFHHVSDEDWERGVRIRYQDICSQYPYQQAIHDFPVGKPLIHVWDPTFSPCLKHKQGNCTCEVPLIDKGVNVEMYPDLPTKNQVLNDPNWFGIVCATVEPPKNLYHPILVEFDDNVGKSLATCNVIKKGHFASIEFKKALEYGYKVLQWHRFDKYKKKKSLWSDTVKDLYINKMTSSSNTPSKENQERLIREYEYYFEMGEDIRKTFVENKWGKNNAAKKIWKIIINSMWGKHAQRPIMMESKMFNMDLDDSGLLSFYQNCTDGVYNFQDVRDLGNKLMFRYTPNNENYVPDLHGSYLPAALFVPAYGRMQLWEQLYRLGKRVLMNDTDSIVYIYDPEKYNIPKGDIWGQWEVEDIDTDNGGIRAFVGLGPKTYAIECDNGKTLVKCKGLSLKRSTEELVNFESMQSLALLWLQEKQTARIQVPQPIFSYRFGQGMHTHLMLKDLRFNVHDLKGNLTDKGFIYPFGYIINDNED